MFEGKIVGIPGMTTRSVSAASHRDFRFLRRSSLDSGMATVSKKQPQLKPKLANH